MTTFCENVRSASYDACQTLTALYDNRAKGVPAGELLQPLNAMRKALRGEVSLDCMLIAAAALVKVAPDMEAAASLVRREAEMREEEMQRVAENLVTNDIGSNVGNAIEFALSLQGVEDYNGKSPCPFDEEEAARLSFASPGVDEYRADIPTYKGKPLYTVEEGIDPAAGTISWRWYEDDEDAAAAEGSDWFATEEEALRDLFETEGLDVPDGREVFEHWLVSGYLCERLAERGETVVDTDLFHQSVWCRTTTGQSIKMDYVIEQIAADVLRVMAPTAEEYAAAVERIYSPLALLCGIADDVEPDVLRAEAHALYAELQRDALRPRYAVEALCIAVEERFGFDLRDII